MAIVNVAVNVSAALFRGARAPSGGRSRVGRRGAAGVQGPDGSRRRCRWWGMGGPRRAADPWVLLMTDTVGLSACSVLRLELAVWIIQEDLADLAPII